MFYILNINPSFILNILTFLFGKFDKTLAIFIAFILLEIFTNLCKVIYNKTLNNTIGLKNIIKKFGYLIIIALSSLIDKILGDSLMIRNMAIYFFAANEGLSILKNWSNMGLPLPQKLYDALKKIEGGQNSSQDGT